MDIKQIIEDAKEAGILPRYNNSMEYWCYEDSLTKFAELTLKRASLSANEQDDWISVDDRLPYVDQDVLVYRKDGAVIMCDYNGDFLSYAQDGHSVEWNVTHWMPLPKFDQAIANRKGGV